MSALGRFRTLAEFMKAEKFALLVPIQGKVGRSKQPPPSECWWLTTFDNRGDDIRRKPAHAKQLPKVTLAVVGHDWIGHPRQS